MLKLPALRVLVLSAGVLLSAFTVTSAAAAPIPAFGSYQPVPTPATSVVSPMVALQVTLETYALDHNGLYPSSLRELYAAAEAGDYPLTRVTREGKSLLSELNNVRFLDPVKTLTRPSTEPSEQVRFPAKLVWEITDQVLRTRWIAPEDKAFPANGAVLYMPVYPDQGSEVRSYYILRLNQQGAYYTENGKLLFYSNMEPPYSRIEAETMDMLEQQLVP
ncbi:MAG: hypothetical protein ACO1RX_19535 [Candidatus Sericytochromatia bacterium]